MSAAEHVFSTSRSTAGEYTYIKTTELNDIEWQLNRARREEAKLSNKVRELATTLLHRADQYVLVLDELDRNKRTLREVMQQLDECQQKWHGCQEEYLKLMEEWSMLREQNRILREQLAARNSPSTAKGTQTISNEYRVGVSPTLY